MNLLQYLKLTGKFLSNKDILDTLNRGEISINDRVCRAGKFDLKKKHKVYFKGEEISLQPDFYLAIDKPKGYSCQKNDNDPCVIDLIDLPLELKNSLFTIGRLDVDTTGLLILTNDGKFSNRVIKSSKKVYMVNCSMKIFDLFLEKLSKGVDIGGYVTQPCEVERVDDYTFKIILYEGKKRQIRLMVSKLGNAVKELRRISIGSLNIDDLEEGKLKINPEQVLGN